MLPPWHQSGLGKVQQIAKLTKSLVCCSQRIVVWYFVTAGCRSTFGHLKFSHSTKCGTTLSNKAAHLPFFLTVKIFSRNFDDFKNAWVSSRFNFFHDDLKESGARGGGGQTDCPKVNDSISPIKFRKKFRISLPKLSSVETVSRFPALFLKTYPCRAQQIFFSPAATFKIVEKIAWSVFSKMLLFASEPH